MKDPTLRPHDSWTELERGLLDAARQDHIPSGLTAHMAKALSGPAAGVPAERGVAATTTATGAGLGAKAWLWGSLIVVLSAGAYAALPADRSVPKPRQTRESLAPFAHAAPDVRSDVSSAIAIGSTAEASREPARAPQATASSDPPAASPAPAPAATARASRRTAAAAPIASLQEELALLERARHALQTGAQQEARRLLTRHTQQFARGARGARDAHGALEPEADALRIELSVQRGDHAQAKRAAERFLQRYPDHPLAVRVARLVAGL